MVEASISSEWEGEREAETWVVVRGPGEMKECWMSWRARSLRESMSSGRWMGAAEVRAAAAASEREERRSGCDQGCCFMSGTCVKIRSMRGTCGRSV